MDCVLYNLGCSEITIGHSMTETSPISFQADVNDSVNISVSIVGRIQTHCEIKIIHYEGPTYEVGEIGDFGPRDTL